MRRTREVPADGWRRFRCKRVRILVWSLIHIEVVEDIPSMSKTSPGKGKGGYLMCGLVEQVVVDHNQRGLCDTKDGAERVTLCHKRVTERVTRIASRRV